MKNFDNNFEIESQVAGDDIFNINMMEFDMPMQMGKMGMGCNKFGNSVMEKPIVMCEHRRFVHEVPHIQPVTKKIINHHEYKHVCVPKFNTVCENEVCHTGCGCKGFKF
ncbi:MAG: hypothetical protein ACK5HL_01955 [Bacilli bacterium]